MSTVFEEILKNEEVEKSIVLQDFMKYLRFLEKAPAKLTATGNLSLKAIDEISTFIKIPRHYLEHGWRIRSQQNWPYLDLLDALANVAGFISKRKGFKRLSTEGKSYVASLPTSQYGALFLAYWECLNWGFLFPFCSDDEDGLVEILWQNKVRLLEIAREFKRDDDGWIIFKDYADYLVGQYDLKLINYLGNNLPDRVHDCIVDILIEPFFLFGIVEIKGEMFDEKRIYQPQAFRFTALGGKMVDIVAPPPRLINPFGSFFNMN